MTEANTSDSEMVSYTVQGAKTRTAKDEKGKSVKVVEGAAIVKKLTKRNVRRLQLLYYEEGYTLGRDVLYDEMRERYNKKNDETGVDEYDGPTKSEIMAWLKHQKLHQLFLATRRRDDVQSFKPFRALHSLSADLIDFTNKPAMIYRYILVVVDNFSRYMWAKAITSKKNTTVATAMRDILDEMEKEFKKQPRYILTDDGGEFKGEFIKLLESRVRIDSKGKERGIRKKRTLAGAPQSNGMVERANGKLKMLLSQNKKIFKGSWKSNLERATRIYNSYKNRTTGYAPKDAIILKDDDSQKLVKRVTDTQMKEHRARPPDYPVGMRVRLKIGKGKLDKMSTPNWTEKIYEIAKILRREDVHATKYLIKGEPQDKEYLRSDLQSITGKVEDIPEYILEKIRKKREKTGETDEADDSVPSPRRLRQRADPNVMAADVDDDRPADATASVDPVNPRRSSRRSTRRTAPVPEPRTGQPRDRRRVAEPVIAARRPRDTRDNEDLFEVEKIVGKRGKGRNVEYKVRWKGYGPNDDTWEPPQNLTNPEVQEDIRRFNTAAPRATPVSAATPAAATARVV